MVFVALASLGCAQPSSGLQTFSDVTVSGPGSDAPAELYLPAIAGPYSAVVVLYGCNGVNSQYRGWARLLAGWGYAALIVDSFRPRGVSSVCNHGMDIPPLLRAKDAFIAADYLRTRHDIIAERIGVIGFSHWTVLKAVLARTVAQDKTRWSEAATRNGHALDLKIYPGVLHGFDAQRGPHIFAGHLTGRDPAAAEDAITATHTFFAARL